MLKKDRQRFIEARLRLKGTITVREMALELACSEETIRRELKDMEDAGLLHRVHGGAYIDSFQNQIPVAKRKEFLVNEKAKISELTFDKYINEQMTIMLDDSSTCLTLAREIIDRDLEVTIITNSLNIIKLFEGNKEKTKLIGIGGNYRSASASFVGHVAEDSLRKYYCDILFLSCPSVGIKSGLMHNVSEQCAVSQIMVERSLKRVLLVDHSKFRDHIRFLIADISQIDAVVTDKKPSDEWISYLESQNVELIFPK